MAVTQVYELDGVTVGATEVSIITGTTTPGASDAAGVYQLWVDCSNMQKGDVFEISAYEKVEGTGGTTRLAFTAFLQGAQSEVFVAPPLAMLNSWDFRIQKISGTDRAFDASIRLIG